MKHLIAAGGWVVTPIESLDEMTAENLGRYHVAKERDPDTEYHAHVGMDRQSDYHYTGEVGHFSLTPLPHYGAERTPLDGRLAAILVPLLELHLLKGSTGNRIGSLTLGLGKPSPHSFVLSNKQGKPPATLTMR